MVHLGLLDTASTFVLASTPPAVVVNEPASCPAALLLREHQIAPDVLTEDTRKRSLVMASGIEL